MSLLLCIPIISFWDAPNVVGKSVPWNIPLQTLGYFPDSNVDNNWCLCVRSFIASVLFPTSTINSRLYILVSMFVSCGNVHLLQAKYHS